VFHITEVRSEKNRKKHTTLLVQEEGKRKNGEKKPGPEREIVPRPRIITA
jgi:hypothetical protein